MIRKTHLSPRPTWPAHQAQYFDPNIRSGRHGPGLVLTALVAPDSNLFCLFVFCYVFFLCLIIQPLGAAAWIIRFGVICGWWMDHMGKGGVSLVIDFLIVLWVSTFIQTSKQRLGHLWPRAGESRLEKKNQCLCKFCYNLDSSTCACLHRSFPWFVLNVASLCTHILKTRWFLI